MLQLRFGTRDLGGGTRSGLDLQLQRDAHQVYHPGFAKDVPYAVVVVTLEQRPKLVSKLLG